MSLLEELLVGIGLDTAELTGGAQGAADEVERSLGGIQAAAAGAAIGGLFIMGLDNAMDATAANTKLTNQLGLTESEAARAGDVAGTVFSQGFGDSIDGVNESLGAVASSMGGMANIADDELQSMSTSAIMLADTMGLDVAESAKAAGLAVQQGLVKDGTEAFDVLTAAAQNLPAAMREDIPNVISEYGVQFSRLGLDAKTAFGMMSQYVQAGGRDIDQAGDVIHEFARITSEETDRAAEAFQSLGLDSTQMLADIHKGGPAAEQALTDTLAALRGMKDPAKQSALAVELFGDMAGEGASALWAMDPATAAASSGMDNAAGAAQRAKDAMANSPAQQFDSIMRTLANTLGTALAPALKIVSEFMANNPGLIQVLIPVLLALALAIGVASIAQWAWNTALWAFPGTWIIAGIIALIAVIVLIVVYWDEIKAATGRAWDWIVSKLSGAWSWISGKVGSVWDWIVSKISSAWSWITSKVNTGVGMVMGYIQQLAAIPGKVSNWFGQVITWISRLPGRIAAVASGMWDAIPREFRSAINQVIGAWNGLSFTIGGGSILGKSIPSLTLSTPNIPYLAEGGLTTGPTLAMIGEGTEQEAVLPLSKLDSMLRGVAGAVRGTGDGGQQRLVLDVTGADEDWKRMFRRMVQEDAGGDVVRFAGAAA
ncbi:phage tail tape measure protein [Streptomyces sp. NRRL F-5135]|uniref:phage tail tape measure protein n=1 Tax=Streptomyces sp. NRRL F-5135 TaxID=1463858 RepID=UPI0004C60BB6|nr:phage tail tape measure protein [Streptomyces sp. NRRL F-5135]